MVAILHGCGTHGFFPMGDVLGSTGMPARAEPLLMGSRIRQRGWPGALSMLMGAIGKTKYRPRLDSPRPGPAGHLLFPKSAVRKTKLSSPMFCRTLRGNRRAARFWCLPASSPGSSCRTRDGPGLDTL
ncbi:hypothetical protein L541_1255 [Bordetella hinzii CA90 BAL1384]|nr:hypothetical protein L541_1255 [Bordetella hinzii CA90 BAL1384]KCB47935.1 hypothetical protein L538_3086 [Bordetella hinzii 4161]